MPRRAGLALVLVLLAAQPLPAIAQDAAVSDSYVIRRDGARVGTQRISVVRDGVHATATGETDVEVKLLGIVLYRYSERWRETWRDGGFVHFEATVDDDGRTSRLVVARTQDGLVAEGEDGPVRLPDDAIPETYWNPATRKAKRLIDIETGAVTAVAARAVVRDTIDGTELQRIELGGKQPRTLWYTPKGSWFGVRLTARDGSDVRILREGH